MTINKATLSKSSHSTFIGYCFGSHATFCLLNQELSQNMHVATPLRVTTLQLWVTAKYYTNKITVLQYTYSIEYAYSV